MCPLFLLSKSSQASINYSCIQASILDIPLISIGCISQSQNRQLYNYFKFSRHTKLKQMNREIHAQASTKQLRKAKILDSFRQPSKSRVMLTDLCPQQKAKIGDLVRTLEARKSENQVLQQKYTDLRNKEKEYIQKIKDLSQMVEESETIKTKLMDEINLIRIKQGEKDKYIDHLINEKSQISKKMQKKQAICVDQYALTQPVITCNQSVQFNQKKRKCKEQETQTDSNRSELQQYKKYPNNSKSFEKIMSRGKSQSHPYSKSKNKVKYGDEVQENQCQQVLDLKESLNKKNQNQRSLAESQNDEDFNELAKKWLQLKEKNMQKIKQSYKKSKQKHDSKQKTNIGRNKAFPLPGQFKDQNNNQQEDDGYMQKMNIQNNDSFGPKKSKKIQPDQDFDDIELNRILKSKNFSASRLLQKNREKSQESDRNSERERRVQERLSRRAGKTHQNQNTPNMKLSSASNSRSQHNIDFYETDLLDIVTSINRN